MREVGAFEAENKLEELRTAGRALGVPVFGAAA